MLAYLRSMKFLSGKDCKRVEQAIGEAEKETSGEIRVHIETRCDGEPMKAARDIFSIIGMEKTDLRNGVLIYLAIKDKKFTILGDEGINTKVPENFWEDVKEDMQVLFRENKFTDGIILGVKRCAEKLKDFFPRTEDDVDELPNTISFGP